MPNVCNIQTNIQTVCIGNIQKRNRTKKKEMCLKDYKMERARTHSHTYSHSTFKNVLVVFMFVSDAYKMYVRRKRCEQMQKKKKIFEHFQATFPNFGTFFYL